MSKCRCSCKKKEEQPESRIAAVKEIPARVKETKKAIKKEINKQTKGRAMKTLFKIIFKLIFKLALLAAAIVGTVIALNKFAPDVFDSLTDWLKDNRDD